MAGFVVTAKSFRQECGRLNSGRGVLRAARSKLGRAGGRVCAGAQALNPRARESFGLSARGHGESRMVSVRGTRAAGLAKHGVAGGPAS